MSRTDGIFCIAPGSGAKNITPNDVLEYKHVRGIYLGNSGDLHVSMRNEDDVIFRNLIAGICHPLCIRKVWETGTTASNIILLF